MEQATTNLTNHKNIPLLAMLREHPGLLLTVLYLIASLIGLAFSWSLFSQFEINIFSYAEVTDFLMAALREPLTFPLTASAILVAWALEAMGRWEMRMFENHEPRSRLMKGYRRISQAMYRSGWVGPFVFVAYAYLFLGLYGDWKSKQIKLGRGDLIEVHLADDDSSQLGSGKTLLLGTTNKFVFVYDLESQSTDAVPNENIAWIKLTPVRSSTKNDKPLRKTP